MNIFERLWFRAKTGADIQDLGKIDDSSVIHFKDYYISVMEQDGEICNLSWSKDPLMFPDVPVREFLEATPRKDGDE